MSRSWVQVPLEEMFLIAASYRCVATARSYYSLRGQRPQERAQYPYGPWPLSAKRIIGTNMQL